MEANKIFNRAVTLLGYNTENIPQRLKNGAVDNINLIYGDLWRIEKGDNFIPLKSLSNTVELSDDVIENIMIYGVCMRLAQSEGDGDQQQTFAYLYNAARAKLSKVYTVRDNFIVGCDL